MVNLGGTIGRAVGTDLFTSGDYKIIKADSIPDLVDALDSNVGDIWGMVVFGHGNGPDKNGLGSGDWLVQSNLTLIDYTRASGEVIKIWKPSELNKTYIKQDDIRAKVRLNNYKLAKIAMMQCYSQYGSHKTDWERLTMPGNFTGYDGVNALLVDWGFLSCFNPVNWF